jgi:hypothetical protein
MFIQFSFGKYSQSLGNGINSFFLCDSHHRFVKFVPRETLIKLTKQKSLCIRPAASVAVFPFKEAW